jgi:cyclophilin family peptidyl-prolyl cis-trans isomerase
MQKIMILALIMAILFCGGPPKKQENMTRPKEIPREKGTYMIINIKDFGTITIKMHTEQAPNNTANIVGLVKKGFYNGLTFHRIIPGFVIQGGCPNGDGTGTPGYDIDDEISDVLKHLKGTVAMANRGPNTNGCQFYICLAPLPKLDGGYTIIGQVVSGIDVVDKIGAVKTGAMDRPVTPVIMESVTIEEVE